jgi:adenosine deaminase
MARMSLELMRAIPKVELHCHLLGTVRCETFIDLARKAGAPIPREEIEAFYIRGEKPAGVLKALRTLDQIIQEPDDLYRLTSEYLEDAAAHTVRYAEIFWNPTGTARVSGIAYPKAHDAIVRAMRDAKGITGRLIPAIDREQVPAAAVEMVHWVSAHRAPEVVGIGVDYSEIDRPPELFEEAYRLAAKAGLKRTAHAGEFGCPWNNVRAAIEVLGVDRIDHGYTVLDNPDYARRCAASGIVFTVVPTNSYYLRTLPKERWALDHPIRHLPRHGIRIHPNTDDPTLHNVTPTLAWQMMMRDFGFGLDDIRAFMLNGIDAAWLDDDTKRRWRREWSAEFDALRGDAQ